MLIVAKLFAFAIFGWLAWYLLGRFGGIVLEISGKESPKIWRWLRLGLAAVVGLFCTRVSNGVIIALAHLWLLGLLADLLTKLLKRFFPFPGKSWWQLSIRFALPIALTAGIFIYGMWNLPHIQQTDYRLSTQKPIRAQGYRIAFISDAHYGTIQDEDLLLEAIQRINALQPDIVILGGNIVEEGTTPEAMEECFARLGKLEAPLGVYFVYGNHDRHMMDIPGAYSDAELAAAIEDSGITILEDDALLLNGDIYLIGRADAEGKRMRIADLAQNAPENAYIIAADHQPPKDAKQCSAAGVDLTLSGHTHGGQIFPAGHVIELFGGMSYGRYSAGNCTSIVSSGCAGWGFPIRTQGKCEYVIVDILPE